MWGWPAVLWGWAKGFLALMCLVLGFFFYVIEPRYFVASVWCAVFIVLSVSAYHQWRNPGALFLESGLVLRIPRERRKSTAVVLLALGLFTYLFLGAIWAPYMVLTGLVLVLAGWLIYLHRNEETDPVE